MGLAKISKAQRQMGALQHNTELSNYLSNLVPGSELPEQQISFDRLEGLQSPGVIDIDNDYGDDIDDYERDEAEKANAFVVEHIDHYNQDMIQHIKSLRGKDKKPLPTLTKPSAPQVLWNPFKSATPPVNEDEQRQIESCSLAIAVDIYRQQWHTTAFDSIGHFSSVAKQALQVEYHPHDSIQFSASSMKDATISWSMRDDELVTSPMEHLRFVARLKQHEDGKWHVTQLFLVPDTVVITST